MHADTYNYNSGGWMRHIVRFSGGIFVESGRHKMMTHIDSIFTANVYL